MASTTPTDAVRPVIRRLADGESPRYPAGGGQAWLTKGQAGIYAGFDSTKQFERLAEADPILR